MGKIEITLVVLLFVDYMLLSSFNNNNNNKIKIK